jgi:hypothetical protein
MKFILFLLNINKRISVRKKNVNSFEGEKKNNRVVIHSSIFGGIVSEMAGVAFFYDGIVKVSDPLPLRLRFFFFLGWRRWSALKWIYV